MLKKDGKDVVLAQTWDYINSQKPGSWTENFRDVANEIMEIRRRQRDAVYLIFGDALWQDPHDGPMCLKSICGERLLDRMCVLTYYDKDNYYDITGDILNNSFTVGSVVKGASMTVGYQNKLINITIYYGRYYKFKRQN